MEHEVGIAWTDRAWEVEKNKPLSSPQVSISKNRENGGFFSRYLRVCVDERDDNTRGSTASIP